MHCGGTWPLVAGIGGAPIRCGGACVHTAQVVELGGGSVGHGVTGCRHVDDGFGRRTKRGDRRAALVTLNGTQVDEAGTQVDEPELHEGRSSHTPSSVPASEETPVAQDLRLHFVDAAFNACTASTSCSAHVTTTRASWLHVAAFGLFDGVAFSLSSTSATLLESSMSATISEPWPKVKLWSTSPKSSEDKSSKSCWLFNKARSNIGVIRLGDDRPGDEPLDDGVSICEGRCSPSSSTHS